MTEVPLKIPPHVEYNCIEACPILLKIPDVLHIHREISVHHGTKREVYGIFSHSVVLHSEKSGANKEPQRSRFGKQLLFAKRSHLSVKKRSKTVPQTAPLRAT